MQLISTAILVVFISIALILFHSCVYSLFTATVE